MRVPSLPPSGSEDGDAPADDGFDERPSKTQRKKQSHELQDLGAELVALPETRLAALPLDESLRGAVDEYRRTKSHEGRRRQMQYIGKLMRGAETEPIRAAIAAWRLGHAQDALALHEAERWRVELVGDDDAATRFLARFPGADAQRLRALVRNARKDAALPPEQRHGRAWRELFQFVKEHTRDE